MLAFHFVWRKSYLRVGFWQVLCMFNLRTQSKKIYQRETIKFKKTMVALKLILGKIY